MNATLPETNIFAPENGWLEDYFTTSIGEAYFQGLCVHSKHFQESIPTSARKGESATRAAA